jgi:hypothetical protein
VKPTGTNILAVIGAILLQGVALDAEEPLRSGKISRRTKDAILAGLPSYDGQIRQAPVADAPVEIDPEVMVLPVVKVSGGSRTWEKDAFSLPPKEQPVAGTGIAEIKTKRLTITLARILFIPIGLKISW